MRRILALGILVLLAACASGREAQQQAARIQHGHEIAQANCSRCHTIGGAGESPFPEAPPFRTLSRNYRVDSLTEAFAEGISVGHPAMPEFQFEPDDIDDLVAYLQSVQEEQAAH